MYSFLLCHIFVIKRSVNQVTQDRSMREKLIILKNQADAFLQFLPFLFICVKDAVVLFFTKRLNVDENIKAVGGL